MVGVFDAGGSAFDSEVWCDGPILSQVLKRPPNIFQSVTVHLVSPDTFQQFKDAITADPRLNVDVTREIDYYAKQSTQMTKLITILGGVVASIMAIGAVFAGLNTMYSAVAERGREIATMRALGFSAIAVVVSFLFEALLISFVGGARRLRCRPAPERPNDVDDELSDVFESGLCFQDHARFTSARHHLRAGDGNRRRPTAGNPRRQYPGRNRSPRIVDLQRAGKSISLWFLQRGDGFDGTPILFSIKWSLREREVMPHF